MFSTRVVAFEVGTCRLERIANWRWWVQAFDRAAGAEGILHRHHRAEAAACVVAAAVVVADGGGCRRAVGHRPGVWTACHHHHLRIAADTDRRGAAAAGTAAVGVAVGTAAMAAVAAVGVDRSDRISLRRLDQPPAEATSEEVRRWLYRRPMDRALTNIGIWWPAAHRLHHQHPKTCSPEFSPHRFGAERPNDASDHLHQTVMTATFDRHHSTTRSASLHRLRLPLTLLVVANRLHRAT